MNNKLKIIFFIILAFHNPNPVSAAAVPLEKQQPLQLSADQVVDRILEQTEPLYKDKEKFSGYEKEIRENKDQTLTKRLTYTVAGGLNYLMNQDEMQAFVQEKFRKMRLNGQILTRNEFEKLDKRDWLWKGQDLTRIWGAKHLFPKKVPHYIVVVDDLQNINVNIIFDNCFPILRDINSGEIYAETIDGDPIADDSDVIDNITKQVIFDSYGYTDFSGPGNILQTDNNDLYFVDTEYKSFYDGQPGPHTVKDVHLCRYVQKRFKLINQIDNDKINIRVSLPQRDISQEQDESGKTALMWAAILGNTNIIPILATQDTIDLQDNVGGTALMYASRNNHADIVRKLIAAGANVNLQTKRGKTALDIARNPEIKALLREQAAAAKSE